MQIVDLSHVMNVHTPGWVGYAGNKMYYAQNLQTQMIVASASRPHCMDTGSADHPMNTSIHNMRPDIARSSRR